MGNRNTPRKRVKRLFGVTQGHLKELYANTTTIQRFHEGRDTEIDLYTFFGVIQDRVGELSILIDAARTRFTTGKWPEITDEDLDGTTQVRSQGHIEGDTVGADEKGDDDSQGVADSPPGGTVGPGTPDSDA